MSKYVKEHDSYWEWDESKMLLINRKYGHHNINENSPEWINATFIEAEDWHDLYLKTGWTDLYIGDYRVPCLWLDPDGECWQGECHEVDAEDIVEVLYGEDLGLDYAGDYLIKRGWVKLSNWMFQFYAESHLYDNITEYQARAIKEWCDYFDLPFDWVVHNYDGEFGD